VKERKVDLKILIDYDPQIVVGCVSFHAGDPGPIEGSGELGGAFEVAFFTGIVVVAVGDESARRAKVAGVGIVDRGVPLQQVDQHPGGDAEA